MKNCYIYIRTASTPQVFNRDTSASIVNQIQVCLSYAHTNYYEVQQIFEDVGVSGKSYDRPGLNKLFKVCRKKPVNALIVASIDRSARSCTTFQLIKNELKSLGIQIIAARDEILL